MKTNKYKILVLSDINKSVNSILKSSIALAKKINADIEFFHVKKPTDIVKQDNQLSAVRAINSDYNATDKEIKKIINSLSKAYDIKIKHTFVIGNVKNEISRAIEDSQPDVIVLGKRLSKAYNFISDNIVKHVLKKHKGGLMIVAQNNVLEPNQEILMGTLNSTPSYPRLEYVKDLMKGVQEPLTSFRIESKSNGLKQDSNFNDETKIIEYVFEPGNDSIKNLSKYLDLSQINLLCLDMGIKSSENRKASMTLDVNKIMDDLNVSLLVT